MDPRRGTDALVDVLRSEGVTHVFGNPGTTELPLVDALAAVDDIHYVLALQEATVVGMADGYARSTGRPAFVNLHTAAGLGNAIGNLTNAAVAGVPLVVTAGQQHEAHLVADPMLSGDLVGLAAPVCKWAHEVRNLDELGTVLRRAFLDAASPPLGPVFVSLPMSTLDATGPAPVPAPSVRRHDAVAGGLDQLAGLLCEPRAGQVALVVGDEVATVGAVPGVVAVAEALGAPVFGAPLYGATVFPPAHPLWRGPLPPAATAIRAALEPFERVLVIGGQAFLVYPYTEGSPLPAGTELLHLAPDPHWPGRTFPVRLGTSGDLAASLAALLPLVLDDPPAGAADAVRAGAARREDEIARLEHTARQRSGPAPMHPMAAAHALVRALPPGVPVVDEAITTGTYVRGFLHDPAPDAYHFCRGGGLGWGMPAACGVSLAHHRAPVLCVVGDGSALYSPQALWTAAHERLPVVFAVVNNGGYRILRDNLLGREGPSARLGRTVGMDLTDPDPDFCALAAGLGVPATRIDHTDDVGPAVRTALDGGLPHLLEIPIHT